MLLQLYSNHVIDSARVIHAERMSVGEKWVGVRIVYLDEREKIIEHEVPAKPYGNILWERLEAAAKKVLD